MKRSRLLLLSVFISVVIIVIIGGTASIVMAGRPAAQDETEVYRQREEEYRKLIEQANQQLEKANADLQALQSQAAPAQAPVSAQAGAMLTPSQAVEIAGQAAGEGQTPLKEPELVSYEGQAAYEVPFASGSVYVGALDGSVLFNGAAPLTINQEQAVQIAADYFKENDVVLADQITFKGEPLFRVVFRSRLMVYVDPSGQIVYAQYATLAGRASSSDDGSKASSGGGYDDDTLGGDDGHEDD